LFDTSGTSIIHWTFIQSSASVGLSFTWGWQLHYDHLKESLSSIDPLLEDALEKIFISLFFFIGLKNNVKLFKHFEDCFKIVSHTIPSEHNDWLHDELDEASWELISVRQVAVKHEFLLFWAEVVVAPKLLHQLLAVELEL
jgi:hypothetical protein